MGSSNEKLKEAERAISMYGSWQGMRGRCDNPANRVYDNYGGRGISVEWESFADFFTDMYETYAKGKTVDRINNDGNYSKENCRWSTPKEQANNRRTNNYIKFMGKTKTATEWATKLGMRVGTLNSRLHKLNWSVEKALTTPVAKRTRRA